MKNTNRLQNVFVWKNDWEPFMILELMADKLN